MSIGRLRVDSNTVALWYFDEASGTTTLDNAEGTATHDLALTEDSSGSGSTDDGMFGRALSLDGNSEYASTADHTDLKPASVTVEAIARTSFVLSGSARNILSKSTTNYKGYTLDFSGGNVRAYVGDGSAWKFANMTGQPDVDVYHYFALTADASFVRLYIDGVQEAETATSAALSYDTATVEVGRDASGGEVWPGEIDQARISNVVRSEKEIRETYTGMKSQLV